MTTKRQRDVEVFDTPSGLGGSYTVSIEAEDAERVRVRVWYGRPTSTGWESWADWDGYTFETTRGALRNPRRMSLYRDRS